MQWCCWQLGPQGCLGPAPAAPSPSGPHASVGASQGDGGGRAQNRHLQAGVWENASCSGFIYNHCFLQL